MSQTPPPPPLHQVPKPPSKRKVGTWTTIVITVLVCAAVITISKWVGRTAGRRAAMIGAPAGVFGTKWLMSESEVKRAVPNAEPDGRGSLIEYRSVYDRDATINYGFKDDYLLIVVVTFWGKASESQYHEVQKKLTADYGALSEPAPKDRFNLYSYRQVDRFMIEHVLYDSMGTPIEQVLFSRTK